MFAKWRSVNIRGMRLALYQPDIPQNTGAILRLAACMGVGVDIIEPCGFVLDDRRLARVAMDYAGKVDMIRHSSWRAYLERPAGRRLLLTTKGDVVYTEFRFDRGDTLLLGRESAGAPEEVHRRAEARIKVPMREGCRSLNVALAAAIVLAEALRQTGGLSKEIS